VSLQDITSVDTGRKAANRVGRGSGSGNGKTSGRGQKGEGARSGGPNRTPLFEGGQMPFWMRLPKRGFSNARHKRRYLILPLKLIAERHGEDTVTVESLVAAGLADQGERIKLVSGEAIERKLTVRINKVTASVRQAVEAAGGSVEELDGGS